MNFIFIGSVLAAIAVLLGSFGAHVLKGVLDDYGKSIFNTATLYHMFHTFAIIIIGILEQILPNQSLKIPGFLFFIGIILFSGSLYLLSITQIKWLGMITPIGGTCFLLGWIILAYYFI